MCINLGIKNFAVHVLVYVWSAIVMRAGFLLNVILDDWLNEETFLRSSSKLLGQCTTCSKQKYSYTVFTQYVQLINTKNVEFFVLIIVAGTFATYQYKSVVNE